MCLVAFAFRSHPLFPLVLAANRDEFFARPAAPIGWWDDAPHILAGRDLQSGGTWLGVGPGGRIAALTNYRDPRLPRNAATSRGDLAARFLDGGYPPDRFAEFLQGNGHIYSPFTLLFGTAASLHVYSNVTGLMLEVAAGVHALSNHQLDTPWPKVLAASRGLKSILEAEHAAAERNRILVEALFRLLSDRTPAADADLPDTGVGLDAERGLSPIFVHIPATGYGTRCSTVLLVDPHGHGCMTERTHAAAGPCDVERCF